MTAPLHKPCIVNRAHLLVKVQPGNAALQRMALNIPTPGTVTGAYWLWYRKGTRAQAALLICWLIEKEVWPQTSLGWLELKSFALNPKGKGQQSSLSGKGQSADRTHTFLRPSTDSSITDLPFSCIM